MLDLYARVFDGSPLGSDEYVISSDEKTPVQARCRCHPALPPGTSRTMRVNHEYERGGALAYLAAYDVHRARVTGLCSDTTGTGPFTDLVDDTPTPARASGGELGGLTHQTAAIDTVGTVLSLTLIDKRYAAPGTEVRDRTSPLRAPCCPVVSACAR